MADSIMYSDLHLGEETSACKMIEECFREFVAPEYSEEGINEFLKFANPEVLKQRLQKGNFMLTAKRNNEIIGALEIKSGNHICLLFVKKEFHRQGIAKTLFQKAIERCKVLNPNLTKIYVNSSPYAINIYKRMGFIQKEEEQIINGIRFTSMVCKV